MFIPIKSVGQNEIWTRFINLQHSFVVCEHTSQTSPSSSVQSILPDGRGSGRF